MKIRITASWVTTGAVLVLIGLIAGVIITANYRLSPASQAEAPSVHETARYEQPLVSASAGDWRSPFAAVAEGVLPAVVSVDTKRTIRRSADPFRDMLREFFGQDRLKEQFGEEQYREYEIPGSASGFIFDADGYIMTNNHVVAGADEIEVRLMDGREFDAQIVGQDPSTDIAIIKVDAKDLPCAGLGDSEKISVGDWAVAVGNPLELRGTVTVGVISAIGRADLRIRGGAPVYQDFIQTDASINFGNSGGPLVNIDGEVIGVNTAINAMASGIGFAIPINLARGVAKSLISEGKVVRGYLGVVPQEITWDLAEAKNLDDTKGVLIANVEDDTPADEAGLRAGDVVTEFGGVAVEDVHQFRRAVADASPGDKIDIVVLRDGARKKLSAKLTERPDSAVAARTEREEAWMGIEVVGLDDPRARNFDYEADSGVLVVGVESGSPAEDGGVLVGDVIVKVDDEEIKDLRDYEQKMSSLEGREKAIAFMVKRGRYTYFVAVKPEKK